MNDPTVINMPFKSRQSKATAVTKRALPSTPRKTREVVKELFMSLTPPLQEWIRNSQNSTSKTHSQKKQLILWKLSTWMMLILECYLEKKISSCQGMKVTTNWRWESGFCLMILIVCTQNLSIHIPIKKLGHLIFFLWGWIGYYLFKPNCKKYAKVYIMKTLV